MSKRSRDVKDDFALRHTDERRLHLMVDLEHIGILRGTINDQI